MKINFVYPNITGHQSFQQGLAYLSRALKKNNHEVFLSDFTWGANFDRHLSDIVSRKPDIIGFTVLSGMMPVALQFARRLKEKTDIPILFGGVHPTVCPDATLKEAVVDYICVGEAEGSFVQFVESLSENEAYPATQGIGYRKNGSVVRNPPPPLNHNLDDLGYPDFSIFDSEKYIRSTDGTVDLLLGRGCPYPCTYCVNHTFVKTLNNGTMKGYIRKNSVDFSISMIAHILSKYKGVKHFNFVDDLFTFDREWLLEFLTKYKSLNTGIGFTCNNRVEISSMESFVALKDAGCSQLSMGIESGNEELRKTVLKRRMSNKKIIEAFKMAKDAGLPVSSYNILGIPGETRDTIEELLELNRITQPEHIGVSIFCPYPGTEIFSRAIQDGMINKDFQVPVHHRMVSDVKHPNLSHFELAYYKKTFRFKVYYRSNFKKALWYLFFDAFYDVFSYIRSMIPVSVTRMLYRIEGQLAKNRKMELHGNTD